VEIYYGLLIDSCQKLAAKPTLGKSYEVIEQHVLGFKIGQHLIFYRIVAAQEIEVILILHAMMDLKISCDQVRRKAWPSPKINHWRNRFFLVTYPDFFS
jgi:hypothetical protein